MLCRNRSAGRKVLAVFNRPNGEAINKTEAEYKKEYKLKYPERYIARRKISDAIKSGKLEKKACSVCGCIKAEAHHEDYSKPMEVIWLCRKHHLAADLKLGFRKHLFKKCVKDIGQ